MSAFTTSAADLHQHVEGKKRRHLRTTRQAAPKELKKHGRGNDVAELQASHVSIGHWSDFTVKPEVGLRMNRKRRS